MMLATRRCKQLGWTLLELTLVLVLIIVLTVAMVYTIASSTNKQQSYQRVAANLTLLVDAAHVWRYSHNNYQTISIRELQKEGLLPQNWSKLNGNAVTRSGAIYSIESGKSANSTYANTEKECPRGQYRCFTVQVKNVYRPCAYLKHLAITKPLHTEPSYDYSNPAMGCGAAMPGRERLFRVVYD